MKALRNKTADPVCLNLRLPRAMHRAVRRYCFEEEISINQYLVELVARDLARHGISLPDTDAIPNLPVHAGTLDA